MVFIIVIATYQREGILHPDQLVSLELALYCILFIGKGLGKYIARIVTVFKQ